MAFSLYGTIYNVLIFLCFVLVRASESDFGGLPYCAPDDPSRLRSTGSLVLVSTLDGRLSALNAEDNGAIQWTIETGPGGMLSSSIHKLELTNNGQWVRMIPSLNGNLYRFNGDKVEAVPITADTLLQSSFRFSDDLVISGGRESRTYGVGLKSGKVKYECTMKGCDNFTENDIEDVLVVQRQTQTVRAVEPQSGSERWNFSVGQHEIRFLKEFSSDCHNNNERQKNDDIELKVIVPEGLVCAVKKSSNEVVWKKKFDYPVVHAWQLKEGKMQEVDLFSNSHIPGQHSKDAEETSASSPAIYLGMHNKQVYIQESMTMQKHVKQAAALFSQYMLSEELNYPRIPWKPVPASSAALAVWDKKESEERKNPMLLITDETNQASTTALSVLYATEYVNGNGYYLYNAEPSPTDDMDYLSNVSNSVNEEYQDNHTEEEYESDEDTPVQIIIVSLWFWWKEVLVISITTALVVNLMVTQRFLHLIRKSREVVRKEIIVVEKHVSPSKEKDSGIDMQLVKSIAIPGLGAPKTPEYISRYLTDFDPIQCLGKGGFGVVFEAKNKIDDCHYAVKRIGLPNRDESREKVMREVKALAKLDHQNIVRYFNAWLECPPPGWQEEADKSWQDSDIGSSTVPLTSLGDAVSVNIQPQERLEKKNNALLLYNPLRPFEDTMLKDKSVIVDVDRSSSISQSDQTSEPFVDIGTRQRFDKHEKSDSFIVFDASKSWSKTSGNDDVFEKEDTEENIVSVTDSNSNSINKTKQSISLSTSHSRQRHQRPRSLDLSSTVNSSPRSTRVFLYIQMQLCRKESLKDWLHENGVERSPQKVLQIFEQIVAAVEYVHMQGLIHRDLKPSNIFFSKDGQIKVGDFGLVTAMAETMDLRTPCEETVVAKSSQRHTAQVGTQLYMSPEQLEGKPYNYKVDIYSLGLILFELLIPFNTQMERLRTLTNLRANIFPPDFQHNFPLEFQLLKFMLSHCPADRLTTFGIRARPPLRQLQDSSIEEMTDELHFNLPRRRESSKTYSFSSSSSTESGEANL